MTQPRVNKPKMDLPSPAPRPNCQARGSPLKAPQGRREKEDGSVWGYFHMLLSKGRGEGPSAPHTSPETAKRKMWEVCPAGRERHPMSWSAGLSAQAQRPARADLSSHMAPEHLKCEQSTLGCAPSAKPMPGSRDAGKKKKECEIAH